MAKQNRFADESTGRISQVQAKGQVIRGLSPIGRERLIAQARKNIELGLDPAEGIHSKRYLALLKAEGLI